ncbi:MAG: methyltransferase domain-containing protein [Planctomycetota bacterium]
MTDEEAAAAGLLRAEVSAVDADPSAPAELPAVPGGWRLQEVTVGGRAFDLWRPADPDASLDDADPTAWIEGTRDPYWVYLWPAAEKTAEAWLGDVGEELAVGGGRVLELGCGVGLVGLAAGSVGARVVFSDIQADACRAAAVNADANGIHSETLTFDWAEPPDVEPFRCVTGSDLIYETVAHGPLLVTLQAVLAKDGVAVFGDPGRAALPAFLEAASDAGFAVRLTDGDGRELLSPPRPGFCLVRLTHAG